MPCSRAATRKSATANRCDFIAPSMTSPSRNTSTGRPETQGRARGIRHWNHDRETVSSANVPTASVAPVNE